MVGEEGMTWGAVQQPTGASVVLRQLLESSGCSSVEVLTEAEWRAAVESGGQRQLLDRLLLRRGGLVRRGADDVPSMMSHG